MVAIDFILPYRTNWREQIQFLWITSAQQSEYGVVAARALDSSTWSVSVNIPSEIEKIYYYYRVIDQSGATLRIENGRHTLSLSDIVGKTIVVQDSWYDTTDVSNPFRSKAFSSVFYPHSIEYQKEVIFSTNYTYIYIKVFAPFIPKEANLYLAGSLPEFGEWNTSEALSLYYEGKGDWTLLIPIEKKEFVESQTIEYKLFYRSENGDIIWEDGDNRSMGTLIESKPQLDTLVLPSLRFRSSHKPRFAGVVTPLFSLRSKNDWGIGDFGCLRETIYWAGDNGLKVVQLLPINDTTYYRDVRDSYPYNVISVDALHPIYLDISNLRPLSDVVRQREFEERAALLRKTPSLHYTEVLALKEEYLDFYYREYGIEETKTQEFRSFLLKNQSWLLPYSSYCIRRDHKTEDELNQLYYCYIQYLLDYQLQEVRSCADTLGIVLKGDIPIGVSPRGIDLELYPHLFRREQSAGAPPDTFAIDGQNWGFPTYNWEEMYQDELSWWKHRLERMEQYFEAFRIDHILGFFRIWEVPRYQESGLLGHFYPALPHPISYWEEIFFGFNAIHNIKELVYPMIHKDDIPSCIDKELPELIKHGVIQTLGSNYYQLRNEKQEYYKSLDLSSFVEAQQIREALLNLCKEVALIQDPNQSELYHPRISFFSTKLYHRLPEEVRQGWDKAYYEFFYLTHNKLWKETALKRLRPLISNTSMLVCAEDLGMIPSSVPEVLEELQILSLDLERMPKVETMDGRYNTLDFPYLSVSTTSTHDMPPIRLWCKKEDKEQSSIIRYQELVYNALNAPSMLAILPLTDWMSINKELHIQTPEEEQINCPENPNHHWVYRFPIILADTETQYPSWNEQIRELIKQTNRN